MSDDGADLGVGAEQGMKAAMGADEEPTHRTPAELLAYIEANRSTTSYDGTANEAAWRILRTFEARPETRTLAAEPKGHINEAGDQWVKDGPDLYEIVKEVTDGIGDVTLSDLGLTGFQWGWAVNAAKYINELPPVPNPAILTIG